MKRRRLISGTEIFCLADSNSRGMNHSPPYTNLADLICPFRHSYVLPENVGCLMNADNQELGFGGQYMS
jgi:hypothetical protein